MKTERMKPDWKSIPFEEIGENITERVCPSDAKTEVYVGLEHLDPDTIHLKHWGHPNDVEGDKFLFQKGDVIFGRRRAYQGKLAVAEFDGICSAHALVVRAKPKTMLPEYLPFFLQSDVFMERAIAISVGSLSPTINWKTLRVQGFIIPSIEEQKHISKILWAADEAIEELRNCITGLQKLIKAIVNEISIKASNKGWPLKALGEIATVERGKFSHRPRNLPQFYGGQYPFVQTGDVHRANGFIKDYEYTLTDEGKKYSKSFPPGTILITIAAVIGATAITEIETWVTDSVVGIIPNDRMNLNFLEYFLRTQRHYLENVVATQTAQKNINLRILRPLQVPVPTLDTQNSIVEKLNQIQRQIIILENHIATCKKLQRSIINNMEITRV